MSKEILGKQIASIHNLGFYMNLMKISREKINDGTFYGWKQKMITKLDQRI